MPLDSAFTAARIIESAENYARADDPLTTPAQPRQQPYSLDLYSDKEFWHAILSHPEDAWGVPVDFYGTVASEWVARVPGLFWTREARKIRRLASQFRKGVITLHSRRETTPAFDENYAFSSERWHYFDPPGKSMKVSGGIGTLRLPPTPDGWRLMTLTTTCNASAGVPVLMSAEVCDRLRGAGGIEGRLLNGQARWQAMDLHWSQRFPATKGVPRGYLVLSDPDQVSIYEDEPAPTQIHPFTIMEYDDGNRELFDFVYATGDTAEAAYRGLLERFFEFYRTDGGRQGRYLLSADMQLPMWDAEYASPADLRREDVAAQSQLSLLERRVRDHMLGQDTLDLLLAVVTQVLDIDEWRTRARVIGQDTGVGTRWLRGGSAAEVASQLVEAVAAAEKEPDLIAYLVSAYPDLMRAHSH